MIYENIKPLNSLMEKPIKPADYGVYCEDGSFPATYGYFQLRYGVSKGEYCGFFHDMLGNELYTNVWRYGEQKWAGWNKAILNSDLETHEISLQNNWVWSSGSLKMQKVLNCVFLEFEAINGSTTEKTTIATIPEGWRPFQWKTTIAVSGTTPINVIIGTDGNIYCRNTLPVSNIIINTMWLIR